MHRFFTFRQFPTLETDRLTLRELHPSDAYDLYRILSNPAVMQYYGSDPLHHMGEATQLIRSIRQQHQDHVAMRWAIVRKADQQLLGTCGFHRWNHAYYNSEMGYELDPAYWSNGYMTEALESMMTFGFTHMSLHRISALIAPANQRSIDLVKRLQFQEEGLLRDFAYSHGHFMSLLSFSLLVSDFNRRNNDIH